MIGKALKFVLLIRSLDVGGAERQLVALAKGLIDSGNQVCVVSFYGGGPLTKQLDSDAIPYRAAGKGGRWDWFGFLVRIVRLLRAQKADIVYSSMPAANILLSVVSPFIGKPRIAWRLASSDMNSSAYDWLSRASYRLERLLSSLPDAIVANSRAGRDAAAARGYSQKNMTVIANGIDTAVYRQDPEIRQRERLKLAIEGTTWVIGQVARADPKKDYPTFVNAAAALCEDRDDVCFALAGIDQERGAEYIRRCNRDAILDGKVIFLGMQSEMLSVYNLMDINTLSSAFGEGFPNTVAEAMACGTPCVVTDVGDSALIVGKTGEVVPPRCPQSLARGWISLISRLEREGDDLRRDARERIEANFALDPYIRNTEQFLRDL